jgi:hypothetical protein
VRPYQVFAGMSQDMAEQFLSALLESAPGAAAQALAAASATMKARPKFMARQPLERQAAFVRRCLSRVAANPLAEEMLAVYFLECRKELLVAWLDASGVKHDDGTLEDDEPAEPKAAALKKAVADFRKGDGPEERELLLRAFAAQTSVDWPTLDALVQPKDGGV